MVLAGVGGRTVEEAQNRMSYSEFVQWIAYRNRWGSLHLGMRIDRATARGAALFARGAVTVDDLSPYDKARATERASDPQAVFNYLKGISRGA